LTTAEKAVLTYMDWFCHQKAGIVRYQMIRYQVIRYQVIRYQMGHRWR
jgi:hypothetical protein